MLVSMSTRVNCYVTFEFESELAGGFRMEVGGSGYTERTAAGRV